MPVRKTIVYRVTQVGLFPGTLLLVVFPSAPLVFPSTLLVIFLGSDLQCVEDILHTFTCMRPRFNVPNVGL